MQHRFNKLATSSPAEFDYVIIGAGSAGSAIAYRLGHRIAIMEGGRIVQIGTPREIFMPPQRNMWQILLPRLTRFVF